VDQALNGRELIYCWGHYVALMAFMILPFLIARNLKHALLYFKYIP
jgi:ABC-2 type transport system permease protein